MISCVMAAELIILLSVGQAELTHLNLTGSCDCQLAILDAAVIQQMWVGCAGVDEVLAVDDFVELVVGVPENDQVSLRVELCQALAEGAHVHFAPGDEQAQVVQRVVPHADVPVREHDADAVDLKALFFGELEAAQPVAVALHRQDGRDGFQGLQDFGNADIPGVQDGFRLKGAEVFQQARIQRFHTVAHMCVGKDDEAVICVRVWGWKSEHARYYIREGLEGVSVGVYMYSLAGWCLQGDEVFLPSLGGRCPQGG